MSLMLQASWPQTEESDACSFFGYAGIATIRGSRQVCRRCGKRQVVSASQQVGAVVCKDCATGGWQECPLEHVPWA